MNADFWSVNLGQGMGIFQLGVAREEILKRLSAAKLKPDADDDDPEWVYINEIDTGLTFAPLPPHELLEINVEDNRLRFGTLEVIDQRLHKVVDLLQIPDAETLWCLKTSQDKEANDKEAKEPAAESSEEIPSDIELLSLGTLWIRPLGLGLGMFRGEVVTVILRKPEEAPTQGHGPLTPAQRETLDREEFPSSSVSSPVYTSPSSVGWLPKVLTLAMFAAMGLLVWRAVEYQRRWNATPVVQGDVIAVRPPPPEPFPDEFTVAYSDQNGQPHQFVFQRNQLYGPHKLGDKVELRFLPEAPDQPLSQSDVRDAALNQSLPWGIGIIATFVVLQLAIPLTDLIVQRLRRVE